MRYRTMRRVDYLTGTQERSLRCIRQHIAGHGRGRRCSRSARPSA
ncbi:hypothetical protein [Streptomyces canarius]